MGALGLLLGRELVTSEPVAAPRSLRVMLATTVRRTVQPRYGQNIPLTSTRE